MEGFRDVGKVGGKAGGVLEGSLDAIVVVGDFSVELKVFFLQWGGAILRSPNRDCEGCHCVVVSGVGNQGVGICIGDLRSRTVVVVCVCVAPIRVLDILRWNHSDRWLLTEADKSNWGM